LIGLKKVEQLTLRSAGLDERWLQIQIENDPSILGLGNLEIAGREHRQPFGGRIDFLMRDPVTEEYNEIEVMLGALDESHIIRTIEYWDIERQRRPNKEHRAVIVAEQITSRFFNVLRLLNRSVPMIAVQLSAFRLDSEHIGLNAVTVLDIIEEVSDIDSVDEVERADRAYWEKKAEPSSLAILDKIVSLLKAANVDVKLTYNRYHIAIGTTGYNFCWIHPRKSASTCHIEFRIPADTREDVISELQSHEIDATPLRKDVVGFNIRTPELDRNSSALVPILRKAEEFSRR
jgi:hypothetical protein